MKLTELATFTDNVAEMTKFYSNLLGSEPTYANDDMAIFMVGETKIFIHKTYDPADSDVDLPPSNHIAFTVASVDEAIAEMTARGLTLEREPADYYWGRSAYLRDPDGQQIEITEISKDSH